MFDRETGNVVSVLAGHAGRVAHLAFSADGSRVATGSHDRTARVWDPTTGELLMTAQGHARALAGVALAPDGRHLLTASWDGDAAIWSIDSGIQRARFVAGQEGIAAMASDARGRLFLGGWDGSVIAFEQPKPRQLTEVPGHEGFVHSIVFPPTGAEEALTAGQDGTARVWNASTGAQRIVVEHDRSVRRAAYSSDGTTFATVSEDGTASVWATATGQRVATAIDNDAPLERLSFRSRLATAASDGSALVWDPTTKTTSSLRAHTEPVLTVVLDPTDRFLATGSRDDSAIIWDLERGQPAFTLDGHEGDIEALAYSRDGRVLVSASRDATARVWNATDGTLTTTLVGHEGWVSVVAISTDGTRIATGDSKHSVRLWDAATGAELCSLHGHTAPISAVAFSPDAAQLVTGDHDSGARLWTVPNCASAAVLSGHRGIVTSAAYAADGTRIATADTRGSAKIWDAASGKLVLSIGDRIVLRQDGASPDPVVSPAQALRAGCDRLASFGAADGLADACERN